MLFAHRQQNLQTVAGSAIAPPSTPVAGIGSRTDERYGLTIDAQIAQANEKNTAQVIAALAIKQASNPAKTAKRKRQLQRELEHSGIAWNAFYGDLLGQARGQVLTEQIKATYEDRQIEALEFQRQIAGLVAEQMQINNDDEAIALLLCL